MANEAGIIILIGVSQKQRIANGHENALQIENQRHIECTNRTSSSLEQNRIEVRRNVLLLVDVHQSKRNNATREIHCSNSIHENNEKLSPRRFSLLLLIWVYFFFVFALHFLNYCLLHLFACLGRIKKEKKRIHKQFAGLSIIQSEVKLSNKKNEMKIK